MKLVTMCIPFFTFSLLFLISSITLSHSFAPPFPDCNPKDRKVLFQIKNHFPNAARAFDTWGPDPNCCSWPTIICDHHGRVTYVYIESDYDLVGGIPPVIGDLPYLDTLQLSNLPNLTSIPRTITKLTRLVDLTVTSTGLSGPIPDFISEIKTLQTLHLSDNKFSGPLPKSLGRANLTSLDVSGNQFTGDASFLFGRNKPMDTIILRQNKFKFDFSNVDLPQSLKGIDMSHNEIYGSLPKRLGQLPLSFIDVSYNKLCGPIPTGRRLKQFKPFRFANNKCLCGPPLAPCKK